MHEGTTRIIQQKSQARADQICDRYPVSSLNQSLFVWNFDVFFIRLAVYIIANLELIVGSLPIVHCKEKGKHIHRDSRSIAIAQSSSLAKTNGGSVKSSL